MKIHKSLKKTMSQSLAKPLEHVSMARTKDKTHVAFILDRSGSMVPIEHATVRAYNEQLRTIRGKAEHDVRTYLTRFDDQIEHLLVDEPVFALSELKTLQPRGGTALFDAIGTTVAKMEDKGSPRDARLVIVISDGNENMSRMWDERGLRRKIASLHETGLWTFVFIGPQNVASSMRGLGFKTDNILEVSQNLLPEAFENSAKQLGKFLEARNVGGLLPAYFGGDS